MTIRQLGQLVVARQLTLQSSLMTRAITADGSFFASRTKGKCRCHCRPPRISPVPSLLQMTTTTTTATRITRILTRTMATKATKKKRQKERQKQLRINAARDENKRRSRMNNLHPAAKMKRILSAADYWFSDANLSTDEFLRRELRLFGGQYVRLVTLATFPKLQGWTTPDLLRDAFANAAASKRYTVVCNQDYVEASLRNGLRRARREKIAEREAAKQRQALQKQEAKEREQRRKQIESQLDQMRLDYFRPIYKEMLQEESEEEAREEVPYEQKRLEERQAQLDKMTTSERWMSSAKTFWNESKKWLDTTASSVMTKDKNKGNDDDDEQDSLLDDNEVLDAYWERDDEDELMEENKEFTELVYELYELDHMEQFEHDLWESKKWDHRLEKKFAKIDDIGRDPLATKVHQKYYNHIKIDPNDNLVDEDVDLAVDNVGSDQIQYTLVRHKRVNLAYSDVEDYNVDVDGNDNDFHDFDAEQQHDFLNGDFWHDNNDHYHSFPSESDPAGTTEKKRKVKDLPRYSTKRQVHEIKTATQLQAFCQKLTASLKNYQDNHPGSSAIGFDVEYCTLEMDIRGNLPAMVQLASPQADGPVGLIWLDKFPNHGKDFLARQNDKGYAEFLSLLGESSISKVGVGTAKDARNLARWWGVDDPEYVHDFLSGFNDLEYENEDGLNEDEGFKSLQDLCAIVLGKELPKFKETNKKAKKKKRKRAPTSHWRRDSLTSEMRKYAVDDAACSIDIWLRLQQNRLEA